MRPLALNESCAPVAVDPRELYYPSGIEITPGARYRFAASGTWQDSWITCGPEGWPSWLLSPWNRLPWQRVFLLCGCGGKDLTRAFPIGSGCEWSAPPEAAQWPDRQLYLFANDWPNKYDNNHPVGPEAGGPLCVVITRIPELKK
ncbi:hypothetical protein [Candidatus Thiodictyon syntrophicum]|nr:hypothetical protein [Candidatus Thiodictyon syntrophicum]